MELYLPPQFNPRNGCFYKGHIPWNKGIPQSEWMDGRKIKRVRKCLEIGRKIGHKFLPEINRKPVIGIKDGNITYYKSALEAEKCLKLKGIKVNRRNIHHVCHSKRKRAGGYEWRFEKSYFESI